MSSQADSISALAEAVLQAGEKLSIPHDVLRAIVGLIKPDSPEARSKEDERTIAQSVHYVYEIWHKTIVAKIQQSRKKSAPVSSQPKSEPINTERQAESPIRRVERRRQYARIQKMYPPITAVVLTKSCPVTGPNPEAMCPTRNRRAFGVSSWNNLL